MSAVSLHLNSLLRSDRARVDHVDGGDRLVVGSPRIAAAAGLLDLLLFYEREIQRAAVDADFVFVDRYKHSFVVRRVLQGCDRDEAVQFARLVPSLDLTVYVASSALGAYRRLKDSERRIRPTEVFPSGAVVSRASFISYQEKAIICSMLSLNLRLSTAQE